MVTPMVLGTRGVSNAQEISRQSLTEDLYACLLEASSLTNPEEIWAAKTAVEMLDDDNEEVRKEALEAIDSIALNGPEEAVRSALAQLKFADKGVRWRTHEQVLAASALAVRMRRILEDR